MRMGMEPKLIEFDSELWEIFRGAYGNIKDDLKELMELDPILPEYELRWYADMSGEIESDLRIAFDNVCEQLWHQMSFYDALYLALPYLVKLYKKWQKSAGFQMQGMLLTNIGLLLATDVSYNHNANDTETVPEEILESYRQSVEIIREEGKKFWYSYKEQLKQIDEESRSMFGIAMLAMLGDREAAFILTLGSWSQCLQYCPNCENLDEDMEMDSLFRTDEKRELEQKIKPADSVIGQWDGQTFDNTYLWFSNLLYELGNYKEAEKLRYFYGIYTCPNCGKKGNVMEQAKLAEVEG